MPVMKAVSSKLVPFEDRIKKWRSDGVSLRRIAGKLKNECDLDVSYNAVFSFLNTREKRERPFQMFYDDLPVDIRDALIRQFTALWTFDSTGIEGNTLTLGETVKVLELGLTISGKPLKEHEEVYGHGKAVELIFSLLQNNKITKDDLFELHRCVMQKSPVDSLRPVGHWKRDYNGTNGVINGRPVYMEYATPSDTPYLMSRWIKEFNRKLRSASTPVKAVNVYTWMHMTFVRIHPFFDGNGRIARLIANIPLLKCGFPPLLISQKNRGTYIDLLWEYEQSVGVISRNDPLLPAHSSLNSFKAFVKSEWEESLQIVNEARIQSEKRQSNKRGPA